MVVDCQSTGRNPPTGLNLCAVFEEYRLIITSQRTARRCVLVDGSICSSTWLIVCALGGLFVVDDGGRRSGCCCCASHTDFMLSYCNCWCCWLLAVVVVLQYHYNIFYHSTCANVEICSGVLCSFPLSMRFTCFLLFLAVCLPPCRILVYHCAIVPFEIWVSLTESIAYLGYLGRLPSQSASIKLTAFHSLLLGTELLAWQPRQPIGCACNVCTCAWLRKSSVVGCRWVCLQCILWDF